jgi:hypothetical protein
MLRFLGTPLLIKFFTSPNIPLPSILDGAENAAHIFLCRPNIID